MGVLKLIALLHLVYSCTCIDQLKPRFEWPKFECTFSSPDATRVTLNSTKCIPENNIPMSLDVYKDKLFVAVPRSDMNGEWRIGVPSSLNYIKLSEKTRSPLLIPYPDWEAHTTEDQSYPQAIVSAIRVRVDRCDRLWVLDEGMTNATMKYPPTIIVYDLKTDTMIRKYSIPPTQFMKESRFTNIAVEDTDCQKTYAYAADMGEAAIVVYSWEKNESWRIKHHYFNLAPEACDYSINGINYTWANSLYGLSLSAPSAGFSTLFFHPMSSNYEFSVSTKYLRNQSIADLNFFAFKNLGNRGSGHQSGASFVDPSTGVLFYSLINMNSVACWNTSESNFTKKHDTIYMNKETMVYPSDIKVDSEKTLWILSNKLPNLSDGSMVDPSAIHFRVFSVPVKDAISNTACDTLVSKASGNSRASFVSLSFVVLLTWLTTVCMN